MKLANLLWDSVHLLVIVLTSNLMMVNQDLWEVRLGLCLHLIWLSSSDSTNAGWLADLSGA